MHSPSSLTALFDRVVLDASSPIRLGATPIAVSPEGYKRYRGRATFGDVVLEYPEFKRNELRPASEVLSPEAVKSMVGVPFTLHHPDDLLDARDAQAVKAAAEGSVVDARVDPTSNPPSLVVDVVLWTKDAQDAVESGRLAELSPGYRCQDEPAPAGASLGGKPYHVVQRGHRYNHLSGVLSARTVLPDGRRARLDEAGRSPSAPAPHDDDASLGEALAALAGGRADAAYARGSMDDDKMDEAPVITTDAPEAPPPGGDAPADPSLVVEADLPVPAAEALAAFTEEDAAILKTLSPEGLALLASMAQQMKAEAAEQAVMAGGEVEVEAPEDAAPPADAPPPAEPAADATVPMAPQALTADAVNAMIADAIAKAMAKPPAEAPKKDAAPPAAKPQREVVDAAAVAQRIAESRRMDAEFVTAIRKDGHVGEAASVKDAATAAYAVIKEHLPLLAPAAEDALKTSRRDAFLQIYAQAEDLRRNRHLDESQAIFSAFFAAPQGEGPSPADTATLLASIGRPAAG